MRTIPSVDALKTFLRVHKNIELLSGWDCKERSKITCKCYCGNIFTATPRYIIPSDNPCGCIRKNKRIQAVTKYLKETKNLEVVSKQDEWRGCNTDKVKLKCFCGNIFERQVANIKHSATSCGCLMYQYDSGNANYLWKGTGELSAHKFHSIKNNAQCRQFEFNITLADAWDVFLKQNRKCALSGVTLIFNINHLDRNTTTASLDRIDSSKGYIIDNIHWIHKTLNKMKMDLQLPEFINLCKLVVNPLSHKQANNSINVITHNAGFRGYGNIHKTMFTSIKRGATDRHLCFDITIIDMWNKFIQQGGYCALTGLPIAFKYKNNSASLDRIDSSIGYRSDNIQWVCTNINTKLKQTLTELEMKHYCSLVAEHNRRNNGT